MTRVALAENFIYRQLNETELCEYDRTGYHRCGPVLTASGLDEMRRQCMAVWQNEKRSFDPGKTWLENALLINIHHHSSIVCDFYFEGPLVDISQQIIGPNIKGATSQLTFKMKGNTKEFPWHQDNGYGELDPYSAISCLTALDDTDPDNGCLFVIPGSHKEGQKQHAEKLVAPRVSDRELRVEVDESKAIPVPMKAGECIFFNCWMLHRSQGNYSDRDRRILFLRYADADAVEVQNGRKPRLGRLLRGNTRFDEVKKFEAGLQLSKASL